MNRKLGLGIFAAFMIVAMLAPPAFAIGPFNAVDNNTLLELQITPSATICDMEMGAGTESSNRWFDNSYAGDNAYRGRDFTQYRAATHEDVNGEIKGADVVLITFGPWDGYTKSFFTVAYTNSLFAANYENKWIYMSSDYTYAWFVATGTSPAEAYDLAYVQWQYGVYYRYLDIK